MMEYWITEKALSKPLFHYRITPLLHYSKVSYSILEVHWFASYSYYQDP
jgi:hypothetical protein